MNSKELKVYAQIQALVIQAKGMEAENQWCVQGGEYPIYTSAHFQEIGKEIRTLANSLDQTQDTLVQPIQYDTNVKMEDPC